jgi:15-cis-phytoene synthase
MPDPADRELDAAGIRDEHLRAAYRASRALHAGHGRSYFLATRMLALPRRPAVHALYGFARYADEIVDDPADRRPAEVKRAALDLLSGRLDRALAGGHADGGQVEPVLVAVAHTARRYGIDPELFRAFLASMRMDTEVTDYPDRAALQRYMYGSAGVIGLQMLPVLGRVGPKEQAERSAETLGIAFQLTNFLRDVGEDLDRGRVYLPADELAAFGVDRELLLWCRSRRRTEPRVRRALAHLVEDTRAVYRRAAPGIELLAPRSRPCIRTAFALYSAILDRIDAAGHDVLRRRVVVSTPRRLVLAAPALWRTLGAA